MLSLGLGLGFGSMEENELEEGEAFSGHADDDDDDCIDPDIALSYIDEKLQNVLGHFQKDFEGGVSAENLGAKFGGYGSFLPAYQRSPTVLSHPRSPPKPPNNAISKSPYNVSVQCAQQKPSVPRGTSVSKINSTSVAQPRSLSRKENGVSSLGDGGCVPLLDSNNKQVNGGDQKLLKVRIRIGPDTTLARSNAAIYSGLGLDTSPFSSPEVGSDACQRPSPKIQYALSDSPSSILQVMTCFSLPGGCLLSPLNDNLFQLTENGSLFSRKTEMLNKGVPEMCVLPNVNLPVREVKDFSEKKNKSDEVNGRLVEDGNLNFKRLGTKMLKKEIDTPAGKKIGSSDLSMSLQSCSRGAEPKAEWKTIGDSAKGFSKSTSECSKEHNQILGKDRFSSPDFAKDDQVISMGNVKSSGFSTSGNITAHSKGELKSKTSLLEKEIEERNPNDYKEISSDTPKEVKNKNRKSYDISKLSAVEYKSKNYQVAGHTEFGNHVPGQRVVSQEKDAEKAIQGNDEVHEGKLRQKWNHIECAPLTESIQSQENIRPSLSLVSKEKKKTSHARNSHSENTSEMLKSRKETSGDHSRESHRDVAGNTKAQVVKNRARSLEPFAFSEKSRGKLRVKKGVDLHPEPMEHPPAAAVMRTAPTLDAADALGAPPPDVIEENWVCCDKCQKWRLLPYGADPHHLPKKWKCSMQVWLPGLNKCFITEDETTKAFNAMYLVPAPESAAKLNGLNGVAASGITSADAELFDRRLDHDMQNVPSTGKKSSGVTGSSKVPKNSLLKKNIQSSDKNRRILDVSEYPLETNSSIKNRSIRLTSKSTEVTAEKYIHKQKAKHEIRGRYSDGGDFVEKSGKDSKPKRKREANQDGLRTSKNFKKENSEYLVEDKLPNLDMTDMTAAGMDGGLSAKSSGKILQNHSEHSSSKDSKCEPRGNSFASITKSKDPVHGYSNGDFRDRFKDSHVEKSGVHDYAAKKRKVKEWQDSQVHQGTVTIPMQALDGRLPTKEGELRKQKEAKVFNSQGKECNMNNVDKKCRSTKTLLNGNKEQCLDGAGEEGIVGGKQQMGQYQETGAYRQVLDSSDHLNRDTTHAQLPTAATSSTSKVSGSRKSKANLQEARGSPVESVSSSPLRTSTTEKAAIRRKTVAKNDIVNANLSFTGSRKRCSDGELGRDQSGTRRKGTGSPVQLKSLESDRAAGSGFLGSMVGTYHYLEKEGSYVSGGNNKKEVHVKKGVQVDLSHAQSRDTNAIGDAENIFDHDNKNLFEGTEEGNIDGDRNNVHDHCYGNGTHQQKDKCYSSFKEKNKTSNSDANKVKVNDSNSVINKKELHSSKNGSHFQSESHFKCNDSNYHEESKDENCNFQDEGRENSSAKQSYFDRRDNLSSNGLEETLDPQNRETNSRVAFVGASCKPKLREDLQLAPSHRSESPMRRPLLDGIDRTEMVLGRGISQPVKPSNDKSEAHSSGSRSVHTPIEVSRSVTYPIVAENGHAINMVKQLRNPDSENGMNPSNLRQAIPNGQDSSPMRKDGPAAANVVLKEARDIKHKANRLKNEGLDHESIGLYFQSALKFLHGALLLELPISENARQGETNSSMPMMQMYSDTARLCDYCAREYERCKEMAAAALAYKCVEVAYMKVAYYKHTGANKDRHELVTALQTGLPGESPSSSASDVDNLNNHCALDKAVSAMAVDSPQIAGNHVISARNRPNFMRLLSYTNDLNCAFDATKKSQNAMAAATVGLEKDGVDGLSSVRKVLDFNFHNVEGLLRLVRLSLESISR